MIVRKAEKEYTMPIEWPTWLPQNWEPMKNLPLPALAEKLAVPR
jgi:hypothetical protein